MSSKTVIIIGGPTASGKTDLALDLAKHFNTAIISADSRQCFRELNIGVAKPEPQQLLEVKHYFINSHSVFDTVNAAIFENLALNWCEEIFSTRDVVILCGGTGLYIKAFSEGLDDIPEIDELIRIQILSLYEAGGKSWLQSALKDADPLYARAGEMENPQRMMRALEVVQSTGRSIISYQSREKRHRPFNVISFGLDIDRKVLYERINQRVDKMMESGLLDEVKALSPLKHLNALQTVGYKELYEYLDGQVDLDKAVSMIKQNTRHYAKRQITWFGRNGNIIWLKKNPLEQIIEAYESARISNRKKE